MNIKNILLLTIIALLFLCNGKNSKSTDKANIDAKLIETVSKVAKFDEDKLVAKTVYDFVPPNYEVLQTLEEEGTNFCFLLIRVINSDAIMQHEYRGELNLNRRGIVLALYDGKNYQLIVRNKDFF